MRPRGSSRLETPAESAEGEPLRGRLREAPPCLMSVRLARRAPLTPKDCQLKVSTSPMDTLSMAVPFVEAEV